MRVFRAAPVREVPSAPSHMLKRVGRSMDGVVLVARGTASVTPSVQRLRAANRHVKEPVHTPQQRGASLLEGMRVTLGGLNTAGGASPRGSWPNAG